MFFVMFVEKCDKILNSVKLSHEVIIRSGGAKGADERVGGVLQCVWKRKTAALRPAIGCADAFRCIFVGDRCVSVYTFFRQGCSGCESRSGLCAASIGFFAACEKNLKKLQKIC